MRRLLHPRKGSPWGLNKRWRLRYRMPQWQTRGGERGVRYLYSDDYAYLQEYAMKLKLKGQTVGLRLERRDEVEGA